MGHAEPGLDGKVDVHFVERGPRDTGGLLEARFWKVAAIDRADPAALRSIGDIGGSVVSHTSHSCP